MGVGISNPPVLSLLAVSLFSADETGDPLATKKEQQTNEQKNLTKRTSRLGGKGSRKTERAELAAMCVGEGDRRLCTETKLNCTVLIARTYMWPKRAQHQPGLCRFEHLQRNFQQGQTDQAHTEIRDWLPRKIGSSTRSRICHGS